MSHNKYSVIHTATSADAQRSIDRASSKGFAVFRLAAEVRRLWLLWKEPRGTWAEYQAYREAANSLQELIGEDAIVLNGDLK